MWLLFWVMSMNNQPTPIISLNSKKTVSWVKLLVLLPEVTTSTRVINSVILLWVGMKLGNSAWTLPLVKSVSLNHHLHSIMKLNQIINLSCGSLMLRVSSVRRLCSLHWKMSMIPLISQLCVELLLKIPLLVIWLVLLWLGQMKTRWKSCVIRSLVAIAMQVNQAWALFNI